MIRETFKFFLAFFLLAVFSSCMLAQTQKVQKRYDRKIEKERSDFRKLLIENPNYFGNIKVKAIAEKYPVKLKMSMNTKYEELTCVGLYPKDDLLEAIIEIKLPYGFKGSLCSKGSKEYVQFYIDYNDGSGFVAAGAPAEVNVHDISFVNSEHLFYAVRKPFIPVKYTKCDSLQIVKVRAILSWEALPDSPGYEPVWGNVVNTWIQIKPAKVPRIALIPDLDIFKYYEFEKIGPFPPIEKYMITGSKEEIINYISQSIEAEKNVKENKNIEKERHDFKELIQKNPNYFGSITTSKDLVEIKKAVSMLPPQTVKDLFPKLAYNPDFLTPVTPLLLKTKYEELKCVGLYPEDDLLEAVIEVKLPYGFKGDLCTLGSNEYVAFYIDWGSGYEYAVTATVGVHDISAINGKHFFYAVKAKIPNINSRLQACSNENIVKVKAILSWDVDPTPYGHTYPPTWGNVVTRNVQIRPLDGESVVCTIEVVNFIHTADISQSGTTEGLAIKVDGSGPITYDRPFAGIIACWGNINIDEAVYYRFLYSDNNGSTWNKITDPRRARIPGWGTILRVPDGEGWHNKTQYETDVDNYSLTSLVQWNSSGKNGNYKLRLELADASKTTIPGQTYDVSILLDNVWPELFEFGGTPSPLPAIGVTVKDVSGDYRKCDTFTGTESIEIFGNFRDDYFKQYNLKVFGGNIGPSGKDMGDGKYDGVLSWIDEHGIVGAVNGGPGQNIKSLNLCTALEASEKIKCAYGIKLTVSDRAIRGRVSGYVFNTTDHWIDAFVTFDWDPAGCE